MPTPSDTMSPLRLARREKILGAAEAMFVEQGIRGATMEGAALRSGVSKATLYSYFADKDALFQAVALRLADRLFGAVKAALQGDTQVNQLITEALRQKHLMVWDVVRRSPFAGELFSAKSQFAAEIFKSLDEDVQKTLTASLKKHRIARSQSRARLLFGAANGLANHADSRSQLSKDIHILVNAIVAG